MGLISQPQRTRRIRSNDISPLSCSSLFVARSFFTFLLSLLLLFSSTPSCTFLTPVSAVTSLNYHLYDSLQFYVESQLGYTMWNITYTPAEYGNSILNDPGQDFTRKQVVVAYPDETACTDLRGPDGVARTATGETYEGKIMLIVRGSCTFGEKSLNAQLAKASVALIYSCAPDPPFLCKNDRVPVYSGNLNVTISSLMITWQDGIRLKWTITNPVPCSVNSSMPAALTSGGDAMTPILPSNIRNSNTNCSTFIRFLGASPINPTDRDALTGMSRDFIFDYAADRSGQNGPLPIIANIKNHTWDPCINRISGIWCQGDRIVILNLDSMNITGILSPHIGNLTGLQQLILSANNFWCTEMPCSFGNLTELRVLNLFHMGLHAFQPNTTSPSDNNCLDRLTNLLAIDASFNHIEDLTRSMLNWKSLRAISLANNQITSTLGEETFGVYQDLEYLNINNNHISLDVTNLSFSKLSKLQYLYMSTNLAHGRLTPDSFDLLPSLLEVDLSNNNITGRLPNFSNTDGLVRLDLSNNSLTGNCSLWNMPNLLYLDLASNLLSEPQSNMPKGMTALQILDLSDNMLTVPSDFDDVGAFLFAFLPLSLVTVHLEYNAIAGVWGPGFLQSYPYLSHVYLAHNLLQAIPPDIFDIGEETLIDLDISNNLLIGALPALPPPSVTTSLKFTGNPGLADPNLQLPSWLQLDPFGILVQPNNLANYVCPSLMGVSSHLSVELDPSYYGYGGCECTRGTYGTPPACFEIPSEIDQGVNGLGEGSFSDNIFGEKRFFRGVDTSFIIGLHNLSTTSPATGKFDGTNTEYSYQVVFDGNDLPPVPPAPPNLLVRAIYITFVLNLNEFSDIDDQLAVYSGGLDLRGERVTFWQGTDPAFLGNIPLDGMYPDPTVTVLGSQAVVNFRSRHQDGTHFTANFTMSAMCPPGYLVLFDRPDVPQGYCSLPPLASPSSTVILLLVTSVIIGVLALCVLGQKMSTIRGLVNGTNNVNSRNKRQVDRQAQAQEIYGPVLSVEETWRRQLKRDIVKEIVMMILEIIGYVSNWVVVIQEVQSHVGPVLTDRFLVGYCIVVVGSTVTGFVSGATRVRVIREIYTELTQGLAIVPTIDMLLHMARMKKSHGHSKQHAAMIHQNLMRNQSNLSAITSASVGGSNGGNNVMAPRVGTPNGRSSLLLDNNDRDVADTSFGARSKAAALSSFGRPLLNDSYVDSDEYLADSPHANQQHHDFPRTDSNISDGSHESRSRNQRKGSGATLIGTSINGRSSPSLIGTTIASNVSDTVVKVKLSSKDPNVQLAWVQRTISTVKLTSFNLIFSTIPFLIINQVKIFENNDISKDWVLQISSLFACILLGVKLLRILALGELLQRRNELVFEVMVYGTGKNAVNVPNAAISDKSSAFQGSYTPAAMGNSHNPGAPPARIDSPSIVTAAMSPYAHATGSPGATATMSNSYLNRESAFSAMPSMVQTAGLDHHASNGAIFSSPGAGSDANSPELMAPAVSLASVHSQSHLFATSASFNTFEPLAEDEATQWAKANQGSVLQLQPLHDPINRPFASRPGSEHSVSDSRTQSSSDSASSAVMSSSSESSWIRAHMMNDSIHEDEATKMQKFSSKN